MISAVSSNPPQVLPSATLTGGAPVEDPTEIATSPPAAMAPPPSATTETALLAPSTMTALVAEQSESAAAVAETSDAPPAKTPRARYEFYMPTREGFSAHVLALAIEKPDAVSSSAGKSDDEIAADARARLDKTYARMEESGKAFEYNSFEGVDWYSLFGDLDPKSLAAVKENRGGLFTEQEQTMGKHFLEIQENFRLGGYYGPTRLMGVFFASGDSGMPAADVEKAVKSWDAEAAKNKADVGVQLGRASMRVLLEQFGNNPFGDGTAPGDRMMSLLVDALQEAQAKDPDVLDKIGNIRTADDLKKQDWFKDHVEELDAIIQGMDDETAAADTPP